MMDNKNNDINEIIIDLSNIRARKYHKKISSNHILLDKYYEKIAHLINDRIIEIKRYEKIGFDIDNINEVKMHDAILVYGSRGNGKSTVMINLKDFITGDYKVKIAEKLDNKVKIFETIDPTIQEEDEDFLLVILSSILKEVENYKVDKYNKRDAFYDSLENVLKIVEATRSKKKDDIDVFDKFYGLKSGVGLAEELHNLFKYTKDIFGVDILVIPIDDVDMNLTQGYQIADSIRKYMSSPYIIPIVAFNIRQMRVVTKYNKYKEFGLKIDDEIELEELSFLRSLPNDYLSKVFPPNRRIYLKSVFEILRTIYKDEKSSLIFQKSVYEEDGEKADIQMKLLDMVSLISELFYETYYDKESFKNIYRSTFLTNRSMRNFLNDCYSILSSLSLDDEKLYKINRQVIKDRLAPDDISSFVTKKHALTWLWNKYIEVAKMNLTDKNNLLKNYNWAKMIIETLPEDNSAEIINKKTYARVWLQNYYRKSEYIEKIENKDSSKREYTLTKICDISGALELAMRSYIPMYLFEAIVKNHNLTYSNADLIYLKSFASRSLQGIAYELSMMEVTLSKEENKDFNPKPIGSVIVYKDYKTKEGKSIGDKEFNIPFLFKMSNQDKLKGNSNNNQIYILSIFKAIALFIELSKIHKDEQKEKNEKELKILDLIEKYRVNMQGLRGSMEMKEDYFNSYIKTCNNNCSPIDNPISIGKDILNIEFKNSSFGILEIATFSKRLVEFFINVRDNIDKEALLSFNYKTSDSVDSINFYLPIITYFTSFTQSLFISLFNSIKEDDMLSIKDGEEDIIIFRKNSLYGTIQNDDYNDHLYQKNISNLKKAVKKNKNDDNYINIVQKDFYNLFTFFHKDIPFFKFLIYKANFLKEIQKECKTDASN